MAGDLGQLVLKFAADVAGFQSDLGRVDRAAKKAAKDVEGHFSSVGAAGVALGNIISNGLESAFRSLFDLTKNTVELGDQFQKLNLRTGVSVEALAGLKYAADLSDSSIEGLGKGLGKLNISIGAALRDNTGAAAKAFTALGIDIRKAAQGGTEQVFNEIADAVKNAGSAAEIAEPGAALLGKGFRDLIPTLAGGSEGLKQAADEARKLGLVLSEETVAASAKFNDALTTLKSAAQGFANQLAAQLLPALAQYADILAKGAVESGGAAESAKLLADALKIVGFAVVVVKNGVEALVNAYAGLSDVQAKLAALDFAGAKAAAIAARDGVTDAFKDVKTAYNALFETVNKPIITKGTKPIKIIDAPQLQAIKETVAAVKVLNEQFRAQKPQIEDARAAFFALEKTLDPNIDKQNELSRTLAQLKKDFDAGVIPSLARYIELQDLARQRAGDLTIAKKGEITAFQNTAQGLRDEISLLQLSGTAREELARQLEEVNEIQEKVNASLDANGKISAENRAEIERLVKEKRKLAEPIGINLATSIGEAINEAFAKGSLSAGFAKFVKDLKKAFSGSAANIAASAASALTLISDVVGAAQASDGNSTGAGFKALANTLAQVPGIVGSIATVALAVDKLFGGKLFGTDFARAGSSSWINFGQGGATGSSTVTDTRQRPLFRGTQTRNTTTALDAAALEQRAEFQRGLDSLQATLARSYAVDLPARIAANFAQTFDKDGNLLTTVATVAGRTVAAATEESFRQFLTAESILSAVRLSAPSVDQLADAYRGAGRTLLEFAQFAAGAQADIIAGTGLLGQAGIGAVLSAVEALKLPGETLSGTYLRAVASTNLLNDSLLAIGATSDLSRLAFVNFSTTLVDALGGIQKAADLISANINEFFTGAELDAIKLKNARATLAGLSGTSGITSSGDEFKTLLARALGGEFDADKTAAILEYGAALATVNQLTRSAATEAQSQADAEQARNQAIKEAGNALQDFVRGLGDQIDDANLSAYALEIKRLNRAFADNQAQLQTLSRAAGLAGAPLDGVSANLQLLAQGSARALQNLRVTVLQGLDKVFGSSSETLTYFNFQSLTRDTRNWAEQLERLTKLQDAQDLTRSLGELFGPTGLQAGFAEFGLSFSEVLNSLGVNISDLTSPEKLAAFGRAAALLGVSAEELARLSGLDFSTLTPAQQAQVTAATAAAAPIDLTAETNQLLTNQSTAQFDASKRIEEIGIKQLQESARVARASEELLDIADSTRTIQRDQANELALLRAQFSALTDELRRANNRPGVTSGN